MKQEPKTFKYPRLYYLDLMEGRLRIIYPNGKVEVSGRLFSNYEGTFKFARSCAKFNFGRGCWNTGFKSGEEALEAMRRYDRVHFRTAYFLGELK